MTTKDLLKLSTRIFTARKGRTALTVLGMGIGFGAILFLVSLGYGLQGALLETIISSGVDVTPNEQEGKFLNSGAIDEMKKIDGVAGVEAGYDFNARIKIGDAGSDARAVIASSGYIELERLTITTGKPLDKSNPKEILVSSAVGKVFGKSPEDLVGQKVSFSLPPATPGGANIDAADYAIAGVVESEETIFFTETEGINLPADIPYAKVKVECESSDVIGAVRGATAIIFDDMVDTAGTLIKVAAALKESGAKTIVAAATHGVFSGEAVNRIKNSPLKEMLVTNTIPVSKNLQSKIKVLSVASILAEAIRRNHMGMSISEMFN